MTGTVDSAGSARRARISSTPFMTGIARSVTTTSGRYLRAKPSASAPLVAVRTTFPSAATARPNDASSPTSSSTSSIEAMAWPSALRMKIASFARRLVRFDGQLWPASTQDGDHHAYDRSCTQPPAAPAGCGNAARVSGAATRRAPTRKRALLHLSNIRASAEAQPPRRRSDLTGTEAPVRWN